jgi:hypothetical protein
MTFQKFLETWNGKYCEVAGSANAKNQCVDLANAYLRDVLGQPIVEWTNAVDFPSKLNWDWITIGLPSEGDLMIFNGVVGHISIFIEGDMNSFRSFDQNYPIGSPCHVQNHNYKNVKGWLHFKSIIPIMTEEEKRILDFIKERKITEGQLRQMADWLKDDVVAKQDEEINGLKATISEQYIEMDKKNYEYGKLLEDYNILLPKYEDLLLEKQNWQIPTYSAKDLFLLFIKKLFYDK